MTLTAITREQNLFNPWALIAAGVPRIEVIDEMRSLSRDGLYCPHCFRRHGAFTQVRFRNPESRKPHFFHSKDGGGSECANYSKESDLHMDAKTFIAEHLKRKNAAKAEIEIEPVLREGEIRRSPDIYVKYQVGTVEAHEIQISPINSEGLSARTNDLKALGCNVVIWYLYGSKYNTENREWLRGNGIQCYHLCRDGDDSFKWTLDQGREKQERKPVIGGFTQDDCNRVLDEEYFETFSESPSPNLEPIEEPYIHPVYYPGRKVRYRANIYTVMSCDENSVFLNLGHTPGQLRIDPVTQNIEHVRLSNVFLIAL